MRVRGSGLVVSGTGYSKGDVIPWGHAYPGLLIHMLLFGGSAIYLAYFDPYPSTFFLFAWGGFGITLYLFLYSAMFGVDEVRWLFINSGLGILGIATQIDWLLSPLGTGLADFPFHVHVVPFLYYILYTFLMRQALLDLTGAYERPVVRAVVNGGYVVGSIAFYLGSWWLRQSP
jgi:hypothetical protein